MNILGIDPGSCESAYVIFDSKNEDILTSGILNNDIFLQRMDHRAPGFKADALAIESIEGFGLPVGMETFDTVFWSGRFCQAFGGSFERVGRKPIKAHLCGHTAAKDKDIREALIYRFGQPGTKKQPGKLYGISSHVWSALAVAVYYADKQKLKESI